MIRNNISIVRYIIVLAAAAIVAASFTSCKQLEAPYSTSLAGVKEKTDSIINIRFGLARCREMFKTDGTDTLSTSAIVTIQRVNRLYMKGDIIQVDQKFFVIDSIQP